MPDVPQPTTIAELREALDWLERLPWNEGFLAVPSVIESMRTVLVAFRRAQGVAGVDAEGSAVAAARKLGVSKQVLHNVTGPRRPAA